MNRTWIAVVHVVALLGLAPQVQADEALEDLPVVVRDEAALRELLGVPVPKGASVGELDEFYREQYGAAQQLGAYDRALGIARAWYEAMPPERRIAPLYQLHNINIKYGDRALGLKYGEELIRTDQNWRGRFMSRLWVASSYLDQYQVKRAGSLIEEGAAFLEQAAAKPRGDMGQFHIARGRSALERLQARFAMLGGKYDEGERLALAAVGHADDAVRRGHSLDKRFQYAACNQYAGSMTTLVRALKAQGRYFEAESRLAEAVEYLRRENWLAGHYPTLVRAAAALRLSRHRYDDALALAQRSLRAYQGSGAGLGSQAVWSEEMRLAALIGLGNWDEARQGYRALEGRFKAAPELRRLLSGLPRGVVRLMTGEYEDAGRFLGRAYDARRERLGDEHVLTAQAAGLYAIAQWRLAQRAGDASAQDAAGRLLERSARRLMEPEGLSAALSTAGLGQVYRRLILEARLDALHPAMSAGRQADMDEGFRIADALRGSSVQEAIVEAAVRASASVPGLGDLIRAIQDDEREMNALYDYVVDQSDETLDGYGAQALAELRARLAVLEAHRRQVLRQVRERFPDFDRLTHPKAPEPGAIAKRLRPGEALLSMLPTSTRTYLWLVTSDGTSFGASDGGEAQIRRWVAELRRTLDVAGMAVPPAVDADAAHQLYRALIAPLRERAGDRSEWIMVGGGVLAQLPFATLLTRPGRPADNVGAPWLVKELATTAVPSAAAWLALRQLPPQTEIKSPFIAFGDPAFDSAARAPEPAAVRKLGLHRREALAPAMPDGNMPALPVAAAVQHGDIPPLPETREEVLAIAKALAADPNRDVFLGARASRRTVLELNASRELAKRRVVMFATHGLVAGDLPQLDQPALALAYTDGDGADWLLTLQDVLSLKLDAEWVVLSACNTAAADGAGGEALTGLGRGFFYAGARAMLLTHWAVETQSAKAMTTGLFAAYGKGRTSRAEALRSAQLALIAQAKTSHPAYWGAFALVGDGGR